jgi:hypothetical protein
VSYWDRNPQKLHLIAKYNPYHDDKGKFASAGGSSVGQRMMDAIPNGGFTYDPSGKVPTSGYAVGVYPDKSVTLPLEDVTKAKVSEWMASNTKLLSVRGNMLGGWTDSGKLYLDIVKVFSPSQKDEALAAGKEHNQISIADLAAIHKGDWDHAIINTGGTGVNKSADQPHFVLATPDTDVTEFLDRLKIYPKS